MSKTVETWVIADSQGEIVARSECEQDPISDENQELFGGVPPYRSVHLVEAGSVEPEIAAVVRAAEEIARFGVVNPSNVKRAMAAMSNEQRRACGLDEKP